jgi:hypothetical protein
LYHSRGLGLADGSQGSKDDITVDIIDYRSLIIEDVFNNSYIANGNRGEYMEDITFPSLTTTRMFCTTYGRTAGTGQPEQHNRSRTASIGHLGQDRY